MKSKIDKRLKLVFKSIKKGKFLFESERAEEKLAEFKLENEGKSGEIIIEIHEGGRYWQHKYFHGYLLPHIAKGMGERDIDHVKEFVLKEQLLYQNARNSQEIPAKHRKGSRIIMVERMSNGNEAERSIIGYVPSLSALTFDEYSCFILQCEDIRDDLIGWSVGNRLEAVEFLHCRQKALGEIV